MAPSASARSRARVGAPSHLVTGLSCQPPGPATSTTLAVPYTPRSGGTDANLQAESPLFREEPREDLAYSRGGGRGPPDRGRGGAVGRFGPGQRQAFLLGARPVAAGHGQLARQRPDLSRRQC